MNEIFDLIVEIENKFNSNTFYKTKLDDIRHLLYHLDKSNVKSLNNNLLNKVLFDKLSGLYEKYKSASSPWIANDIICLAKLEEYITKLRIKQIPVKYRQVTIIEAVDSGIFAHELEALIAKVISNKVEILKFEDRFEIVLEKELEELADEALKSLLTFK